MRQNLAAMLAKVAVVLVLVSVAATPAAAGDFPTFEQVRKATLAYFQKLPEYQPGGILSRSEAEPLFSRLKQMGWVVADREAILAAILPDNAFMVQQLRTPVGRKFAVQISAYPDGYDRLDRLSRLPRGKAVVRNLILATGGQEMIEYMTTTPGGVALGKMLSQDPRGAKFNQPTGRIYTVEMLLDRLKRSYDVATGAAPKPN